jgi:hypothetical protein
MISKKSIHSELVIVFFFIIWIFCCPIILQIEASEVNKTVYNQNSLTSEEFAFTKISQWFVKEGVYALDVTVDGDIAYVCTNNYLAILDVSDLANPTLLQNFSQFGNYFGEIPQPRQVIVFGDFIFLTAYWHDMIKCWTHKIMVLDVSDLSNLTLVHEFNLKRLIYDICLVDNYLYVSSSGDFRIYDVENASNPSLLCNYTASGFFPDAIGIKESFAFLGSYSDGYQVLDISNPTNPIMIKNSTDFSIYEMHIEESIAYTLTKPYSTGASSGKNFTIFNITGSYDLEETNHIYVGEEYWDFIFSDGYTFMKQRNYDLMVLDVTDFNHINVVYQSTEEEFIARGFSIKENNFYVAAGSEGLIIFKINYATTKISLNQSTFLIFFVGIFAFGIFLKRKRR